MPSVARQQLVCVVAVTTATACLSPTFLRAQEGGLEEIVVTAQRREQSLQEVPISLEAFNSAELRQQGFRTMDDLANFSPTVEIDIRTQDQDISVRGMGTTGNNLTLEQAVPTFVDGIHFGRTSMIKSAFLDLERVEVLRGPQPVYFGQNATAGAFSLVTRKPGDIWEGDLTAEIGNFGRYTVEGGVGGPVTDTFGVRVAGKWDTLDGYMTDIVSGDDFPERTDLAGRVTLQWAPTDRFEGTLQFGIAQKEAGADGAAICRTDGEPRGIQADWWIPGVSSFADTIAFIPPGGDCFSDLGISEGRPPFYAPPTDLNQEDADAGILDIREMAKEILGDVTAQDDSDSRYSYIELSYHLDNGIVLTSLSGYIDYWRQTRRDNDGAPFITNVRSRKEDFISWSQEFRVTSASGGAIEWMVGAYYQKQDLDLTSHSLRANVRRPQRFNDAWQDAEWLSAFGTMTFNFLDDKMSLDVGGRLTDVEKTGFIIGYGGRWIMPDGTIFPWRTDVVPDEYDGVAPVGITPLDPAIRETHGPYLDTFEDTQFDPQVTLRYRPTPDISTYIKWAQAFKSGGFDTGASSLPDTFEQFSFLPEFAENFEVGVRGTFFDDRVRGGATLFRMEIDDLQIATATVDPGTNVAQGSRTTNAGKQRVQGLEFDVGMAFTERLTASLAGAVMDGEMVEYEGAGCTDAELRVADSGPCISEAESNALAGDDSLEGLIDRSGDPAPRTPDYKFVLGLDYAVPIMGRYEGTINGDVAFSDSYIDDVEGFSRTVMWGKHTDLNLSLGIGNLEDSWRISLWGRNLLEAQPEYNPEFDVDPDGRESIGLSLGSFRTYGVQLQYSFY